jgi:hypothetical protein
MLPRKIWQWMILGLILLIALGFRIAEARTDDLAFDELWHLELSTGRGTENVDLPMDVLIPNAPDETSLVGARPWYAVWTHMTGVVHPPLYCTTLRIWRDIFGSSDAVAISLSIVFALIAITLMFFAAMQTSGFTAAAWAAMIFAAAPTQFWAGEQVRGYSMLQAVGMASVLVLLWLEKSPTIRAAAALGLCVLALMLTHYFAIGGAIAIGAYACIRFRGRKLKLALASMAIAAIVYAIVWAPFMLRQRAAVQETDSWLIENSSNHLFLTFGRLALWPWESTVSWVGHQFWPYLSGLILVIPLFLLRRRRGLLLWFLWAWGTPGFLLALDLIRGTKHLSLARYLSLAAPGAFVLFTAMLEDLPAIIRHGLPAAAVIGALIFARTWFSVLEQQKWRELGEIVDREVLPSQVLLFHNGGADEFFTHFFYLDAAHYSHQFPRAIVKLAHPDAALMRQLSNQTAWLITVPNASAQDILPGAKELWRIRTSMLADCIEVQLPAAP